MICKICNNNEIEVIYNDYIRTGGVGNNAYTKNPINVYKCLHCKTIWNDFVNEGEDYYNSEKYRESIDGDSNIENFYNIYDIQNFSKFEYTGTEIFRNKVVADIGCGGGAFLDCLKGVSSKNIAIEPSMTFQESMNERGYETFSYAKDALNKYKNGIDVVVSFDCIEHVENPKEFVKEAFDLLKVGGTAIIGTPTDAKVMRELLGKTFEKFLFTTQHPYILGEKSFIQIAKEYEIEEYSFQYHQRYTLDNCLYWLQNNKGCGYTKQFDFITNTMNKVWMAELEQNKLADYIVFKFTK